MYAYSNCQRFSSTFNTLALYQFIESRFIIFGQPLLVLCVFFMCLLLFSSLKRVDCEWAITKSFDKSKAQDLEVTEEKKITTVK